MSSSYLTAFNNHFSDFVDDIQSVFPNDPDILTAKNSLALIRKANPRMIIKIWSSFIMSRYREQIEAGDIDFFINKDYNSDVKDAEKSEKIMEAIDRLRGPVKMMSRENQEKSMKYMQNLCKICQLYESSA